MRDSTTIRANKVLIMVQNFRKSGKIIIREISVLRNRMFDNNLEIINCRNELRFRLGKVGGRAFIYSNTHFVEATTAEETCWIKGYIRKANPINGDELSMYLTAAV